MPACVLIDKLDKQTPASLAPEFAAIGLRQDTVDQLLQHLQVSEQLSSQFALRKHTTRN